MSSSSDMEDKQGKKRKPSDKESFGGKTAGKVMKYIESDSDTEEEDDEDDLLLKPIKNEVESNGESSCESNGSQLSQSEEDSTDDDDEEQAKVVGSKEKGPEEKIKSGDEKNAIKLEQHLGRRGRPKQPRRLNIQKGEGLDDNSKDEGSFGSKQELKHGKAYSVEFKLKVLKFKETHSNAETADHFGLHPQRVREWIRSKQRIEEDSKNCLKRHPRMDGFTVEQKLNAVKLATERSIDEARLLYNVDRNTIGRWKAMKEQLEERMLRGEGSSIRQTGSGRKPRYTQIEEDLKEWIVGRQLKGETVTKKMILDEAKTRMEDDPNTGSMQGPRTWSWVAGFLKRQNLHELFGNSSKQEDAEFTNPKTKASKVNITKGQWGTIFFELRMNDEGHSSDVQIKQEVESDNYQSSSCDEDNLSQSWNGSSDEEKETKKVVEVKVKKEAEKKKGVKRKEPSSPKPRRPRGRPKQPRRLNIPEGAPDDYTSDEEDGGDDNTKPILKPGSGYPVEFKLKVLRYADTHSSTATAEKFGLQPVRVRDWKRSRYRIEEESKGSLKRRPRSDGFTVEEKLQAVEFATERSIDEARLLYNVDRNTIGKWKAKKEQLEARLLQGQGNSIRQTGSGRKPKYTPIEDTLRDWIVALRLNGVTLNYKMILNKAKTLMTENPTMHDLPVPRTWSWVTSFLKRHNLSGLLGNTLGHEDPRELLSMELKLSESGGNDLAEKLVEIPENPNKRNRRTIALEDKVNIIRRIEHGESQGSVAKSLKVATSTIQTIWSGRNEILHKYTNPKASSKSESMLWKTYSAIGSALHDWLEQSISRSLKVDLSTLMTKAVQLSATYKQPRFSTDAKQWLKIFCKRHKLAHVLDELKNRNNAGGIMKSPSSPVANNSYAEYAADSTELPDDDFHSDANYNDHLSNSELPISSQHPQPPPQPSSISSTMSSHHDILSENFDHQRLLTSSSVCAQPVITTREAVKYYTLLRTWIQTNYGSHDDILNSRLSGLENSILKRRMNDMDPNGSYSQ